MREFCDDPYQYVEPRPSRLITWLAGLYNRFHYMPGPRHRIKSLVIENAEEVKRALKQSAGRLLIVVNHPSQSDPPIMYETFRRLRVRSFYMSAYDLFLRNKFDGWVMQHVGVFSIDREAMDKRGMKQSMATVVDGKFALTVFPEGYVYRQNDRVTPFSEGTALIGMRSQRQMGKDAPVLVLPVAIKVTHLHDQRSYFTEALDKLASEVNTRFDPKRSLHEEVVRIGRALLRLQMKGFGHVPPAEEDAPAGLSAYLESIAGGIVGRLESEIGLKTDPDDIMLDRVKRVRRHIHTVRLQAEDRTRIDEVDRWSDEILLAFRILTYANNYLAEKPTIDRLGETLERLQEDHYSRAFDAYGERAAMVRFCPAIDLSTYLDSYRSGARETIRDLTKRFESSVQNGIDALNEKNPHPGGWMLDSH